MKRINMNNEATEVCRLEGKKIQVNRAQVKEVLKCFCIRLANNYIEAEVLAMLKRYKNKEVRK